MDTNSYIYRKTTWIINYRFTKPLNYIIIDELNKEVHILSILEDSYHKEKIAQMLEASSVPLTFEDVVTKGGHRSENGSIILKDGSIYALKVYGTHGLIEAILYPDTAKQFGLPKPTGKLIETPKMTYQAFDLTYGSSLPLIRISCGLTVNISIGVDSCKPNAEQLETLRKYAYENDLMQKEVFSDLDFDGTFRKFLQYLNRESSY